jgi:hypothetical protein
VSLGKEFSPFSVSIVPSSSPEKLLGMLDQGTTILQNVIKYRKEQHCITANIILHKDTYFYLTLSLNVPHNNNSSK